MRTREEVFGRTFKGIGNLVDLASKLEKEGGVISKQGEIKGSQLLSSMDALKGLKQRKDIKGVYGFTMLNRSGGSAVRGGILVMLKTAKGPVVEEIREPIVDIFKEKDNLVIIAEIPSGRKHNQNRSQNDILILEAGRRRPFTIP